MSRILKAATAAAVLAFGATVAVAQTAPPAQSKTEPGAPEQAPPAAGKSTTGVGSPAAPAKSKTEAGAPDQAAPAKEGVGSRPMGPPATDVPGKSPNPTGQSQEKQKGEANDPNQGGKKQ